MTQGPEGNGFLTVLEIARRWNLSEDVVRRIFEHEPGVLVIEGPPEGGHRLSRRRYRTLRIPADVEAAVRARRSNRN